MSKKNDIFNDRYSYANGEKTDIVIKDDYEELSSGKKKWSKKKKAIMIPVICISTVIVLILGSLLGLKLYLGDDWRDIIDRSNSALGIKDNFKYANSGVVNIALFGIDASSSNTSRSDTIMIVSVNGNKGTVKVSSILRDSYVPIELPNGNTIHEKITHAYYYGCVYQNEGYKTSGPELAIKTLNQNFDLDIRDYVAVNFEEAAEIVDYFGGIDIVITEAERRNMNAMDYHKLVKNNNEVTQTGLVHLNGMQACQYSRIREIDTDNERTNRQGKVLEILLEKIKGLSITQYPSFIKTMLGIVKTSMNYSTIFGFTPLISSKLELQRITFPQTTDPDKPYYMAEGSEVIGGMYDGAWVWRYDLDVVSTYLHNFIYETDIDVSKVDYSDQPTYTADDDDGHTGDKDPPSSEESSFAVSDEEQSSTPVSSVVASSTPTVSSEQPVSSETPVSSQTPVSSTRPVSSQTPVSSTRPVSSQTPVSSTRPVSSQSPVSSTRPVSSEPSVSSEATDSGNEGSSSDYDVSEVVSLG